MKKSQNKVKLKVKSTNKLNELQFDKLRQLKAFYLSGLISKPKIENAAGNCCVCVCCACECVYLMQ